MVAIQHKVVQVKDRTTLRTVHLYFGELMLLFTKQVMFQACHVSWPIGHLGMEATSLKR